MLMKWETGDNKKRKSYLISKDSNTASTADLIWTKPNSCESSWYRKNKRLTYSHQRMAKKSHPKSIWGNTKNFYPRTCCCTNCSKNCCISKTLKLYHFIIIFKISFIATLRNKICSLNKIVWLNLKNILLT